MKFDAFIGGSYESEAATADTERTINWYPETIESRGATSSRALYPTPGVVELDTATSGKGRAHYVLPCSTATCAASKSNPERLPPRFADGREFLIIGETLYEANSDGDLITYGTLSGGVNPSPSTTPAQIQGGLDNVNALVVCSGIAYYFVALGSSIVRITDLDSKADMCGFMDGYWLVLDTRESTIYISNLNDVTTWTTGTDFAQRSLAPDPWRAMKVFGRYVWLFGELTTELWQDVGETFPFAPIPNALIHYGIAAPHSAAIVDNTIVWLARNDAGRLCVVRAGGVNVQTISTHAVEQAIAGYADYDTAVADSYAERGHSFYVLNFDESDVSWCWDSKTQEWHERGTWNSIADKFTAWRPRHIVRAHGELRCLDSGIGQGVGSGNPSGLYRLGPDLYTDIGGTEIRRVRRSPALMNENKRIFYNSFEVDLEPGLGTNGQGADPQAMLRLSNDGGKTWGNEIWRSAGKTGEYSKRLRWLRLGEARRRVFELTVSDPIPWRVTGAYLESEPEL